MTPKLLADAMLGRLARWLRVLGYDTAYLADTDDLALMRLARAEGRLLLTRDRALAARRGVETMLISSEQLEAQLRQVWTAVGPPEPARPRCPVCNQVLDKADPALVAARVPPYVRRRYDRFSWCQACQRVYWPGSHWERMQTLIDGLRDAPGSDKMGAEGG